MMRPTSLVRGTMTDGDDDDDVTSSDIVTLTSEINTLCDSLLNQTTVNRTLVDEPASSPEFRAALADLERRVAAAADVANGGVPHIGDVETDDEEGDIPTLRHQLAAAEDAAVPTPTGTDVSGSPEFPSPEEGRGGPPPFGAVPFHLPNEEEDEHSKPGLIIIGTANGGAAKSHGGGAGGRYAPLSNDGGSEAPGMWKQRVCGVPAGRLVLLLAVVLVVAIGVIVGAVVATSVAGGSSERSSAVEAPPGGGGVVGGDGPLLFTRSPTAASPGPTPPRPTSTATPHPAAAAAPSPAFPPPGPTPAAPAPAAVEPAPAPVPDFVPGDLIWTGPDYVIDFGGFSDTQSIDTSSFGDVTVSAGMRHDGILETSGETMDTVQIFYRIDRDPEQLWLNVRGDQYTSPAQVTLASGSELTMRTVGGTSTDNEFYYVNLWVSAADGAPAPVTNEPTEAPVTDEPTETPVTNEPTEVPVTNEPTEMPVSGLPTAGPTPWREDFCGEDQEGSFFAGAGIGMANCTWLSTRPGDGHANRLCQEGTAAYELCRKTCRNCNEPQTPPMPTETPTVGFVPAPTNSPGRGETDPPVITESPTADSTGELTESPTVEDEITGSPTFWSTTDDLSTESPTTGEVAETPSPTRGETDPPETDDSPTDPVETASPTEGETDPPLPDSPALEEMFADATPSTGAALEDPSSPQFRTLQWLEDSFNDAGDSPDDYPEWRVKQWWSLGTLAFSTDFNSWNGNSDWLDRRNECNWRGITCDSDGRVTRIQLSNNGLEGSFPPELALLADSLTMIDVSNNNMQGPIPRTFGQFGRLEFLLMAENNFSGEIPREIGGMTNLRVWEFHRNINIRGEIPFEITELEGLEELSLYYTQIDEVPDEVCNMPNLEALVLDCRQVDIECWTRCLFRCGGNTGIPCDDF